MHKHARPVQRSRTNRYRDGTSWSVRGGPRLNCLTDSDCDHL